MGGHPKPVDDDVERALASMRAGFLSGSEQLSADIAALDQALRDAPSEEREAVHAQVARLVAAHDRVTARVTAAPATAWDSFKVMVNAVKQQQDVLGQIGLLVEKHVLPRLPDPPPPVPAYEVARTPEPAPRDESRPVFAPDGDVRADTAFHAGGGFRASDVFHPTEPLHAGAGGRADAFAPGDDYPPQPRDAAQHRPGARRQARGGPAPQSQPEPRRPRSAAARARREDVDEDDERPSLLAVVRERTAGFRGLAAMVAVGVLLSILPRERLQAVGTQLFELIGPVIGPAGIETVLDDPPKPPPTKPRSVERIPSAGEVEAVEPVPDLKPAPKAEWRPEPKVKPAPPKPPAPPKQVAVAAAEEPPPAPTTPPPQSTEAPPAPTADPAPPPPSDGTAEDERFVPVVFTHKDHATVLRALADLKQQYPKILIGLAGEVQPVDMGKKGIWHRLVLLPAGPRPAATRICDQLAAQGYDRCYVRQY